MKKYFILLTALVLLVSAAVFAVYADEQTQAESQGIWCPYHNEYIPEDKWTPWTATGGDLTTELHYYLADTFTAQISEIFIPELRYICLDLRGNAWITEGIRPLELSGELSVFDSVGGGTILTTGAHQTNGGLAYVNETGSFNLYSGTVQRIVRDDIALYQGGLFFVNGGAVKLYGGKVSGGVVEGSTVDGSAKTGRGGNIYLYGGALEIYGGVLEYGMTRLGVSSNAQGGNVYATNGAQITVSNGSVKGGYSDWDGGNIYVDNAKLNLSGTGAITGGHAVRHGGNISVMNASAVISLTGGSVTGGVAGGILTTDTTEQGGGGGGNLYGYLGTLNMADTTIDGNIRLNATMTSVTLSGKVKIGLGTTAGLLFPSSLKLNVSDLEDGSEIFVRTSGSFTEAIPADKLDAIFGYFKGAVRTQLTKDTTNNTINATQGSTGYCPHCYDPNSAQTVTWTALSTGEVSTAGHYYLTKSHIGASNYTFSADCVLDLAGYTMQRTNNRVILYGSGVDLDVMDSVGGGRIIGTGTHASHGAIQLAYDNNTFTLHSGNLIFDSGDATVTVPAGSLISAAKINAKVRIKGGVVSGGKLKADSPTGGGNIYLEADTAAFEISGGIIKNGDAGTGRGGNIYSGGAVTVSGGVILDGSAPRGGNVCSEGLLTVSGGIISGGIAADNPDTTSTEGYGGNIYSSQLSMSGGAVMYGKSDYRGGNIYLASGTTARTISGGTVIGGESSQGGNICQYGSSASGSLTVSASGMVACGTASDMGGNIYIDATGTLNISGAVLAGQATNKGGNLYLAGTGGKVNVTNGALISAGNAGTGGNMHINNGQLTITGGTVCKGTANEGGNIYLYNIVYAKIMDDKDTATPLPVIRDGVATTSGGNIYYYGYFTGTPTYDCMLQLGNCVISGGSAKYGNNLYIYKNAVLKVLEEFDQQTSIYFHEDLIENETVLDVNHVSRDGVFTGTLRFENDPGLPEIMTNSVDTTLVIAKAALMKNGSLVWFKDNETAIGAYDANTAYILPDDGVLNLTINDNIENTYVVDLAGKELTVSGDSSIKVYCFDSANQDLITNGKVTMDGPMLQNTKDHQVDGVTYITVADQQEADTYSFHCLNMRVSSVSIRPGSAGVYYSCTWECDPVVEAMIENFGVAVSVKDMPDAGFENDGDTLYTEVDVSKLVIGDEFNSVLIDKIFKKDDPQNGEWGTTDIYATPYVTLEGGQKIVCQDEFKHSLRSVLELFDTNAYYANKLALEGFYKDWESVLSAWDFENIGVKPGDDDVLRILMVGNSYCFHYVEELYALLMENLPDGVNAVEIYNLYSSGRSLSTHLKRWQAGVGDYQLFKVNERGRQELAPMGKWSLEMALAQGNWDYISLQGRVSVTGDDTEYDEVEDQDLEAYAKNIGNYAEPLLDRFHEMFPDTQLLWHRTWASENRIRSNATMAAKYDKNMQYVCEYMSNVFDKDKPYDLKMVNTGAAWTEARRLNEELDLLPYGGLCAMLARNSYDTSVPYSGDGTHDGDIGGAQLLNAYIWYMTITGDSELSDSQYAPVYVDGSKQFSLSADLIDMLKEAAESTYKSMQNQ